MVKRFRRKRPVEVEAFKWNGEQDNDELFEWLKEITGIEDIISWVEKYDGDGLTLILDDGICEYAIGFHPGDYIYKNLEEDDICVGSSYLFEYGEYYEEVEE